MKKLVIKMKVVTDGMVHHMTKAFMDLEVFLAAVMTVMALKYGTAIQTIILIPVMFFHDLIHSDMLCSSF